MKDEKSNEQHSEKEMPVRSAADPLGNTSYGSGALRVNTGFNNTAFGSNALTENTTGERNTAIGDIALTSNTTGLDNTAIGVGTLAANTIGSNNNAIGSAALNQNIAGTDNNAMGRSALGGTFNGSFNNAMGTESLSNTDGSNNTAVGHQAGFNLSSGGDNTALGFQTLDTPTIGFQNTAIGSQADVQAGIDPDPSNCTALGFGAIGNQSNTVQIGENTATVITDIFFGDGTTPVLHADSITPSDKRIKQDVRQDVPGIEFIKKLNPITYCRDIEEETKYNPHAGNAPVTKDYKRRTGFIAQEVEEAAKLLNYDFDALHIPENKDTHLYKLSYSTFVVPLVKAVQEQQKLIEDLQAANIKQQELNEELQLAFESLQVNEQ